MKVVCVGYDMNGRRWCKKGLMSPEGSFEGGKITFFVRFEEMDNKLQKLHSCSSSTCNGWRNENCNVVFRGGGVSTIDGVSPLCLCGEKTVNGHEGGCNFFKWCCDNGSEKSYMNVKWEEKHECLSKKGEMGGETKMMSDLHKSVKVYEKWMKVLIGLGTIIL
ncbi:hypothetical protein V8G54_003308 [Vigna mungo]|uniref:Uncharacterized protein n=1 Tax=Vigna mungo TaxID=3915 RepID=A0AAQ3PC43_VIGMU